MALPDYNMRQLLELKKFILVTKHIAGIPKWPFIYLGTKWYSIIDLATAALHQALVAVRDTVAAGGFDAVCRHKRQATEASPRGATMCSIL